MSALVSVPWTRWTWLECPRTNYLRVCIKVRSSCRSSFGTKLALSNPKAAKSAIQVRFDVGLAAGNRLDVRGVGDDHRELPVAQNLPHWHPVDTGGIATVRIYPKSANPEGPEVIRRRIEASTFPRRLAPVHQAQSWTSGPAKRSHVHDLHDRLHLSRRWQGRRWRINARKQAPGRRRPYVLVGCACRARRPEFAAAS
jgi:hypothetical protein